MLHQTTSSPTPRARRRDANLSRILDAAMELIATSGLESLSMGRLADAVDYTAGALYRYFPSKDALLSALVAQVLDEVQLALVNAEARLPKGATPLMRVVVLAHGYRQFAKARPHAFGLLASTIAEPRVLLTGADVQPVVERSIALLELLANALGEAAAAGLIDAPTSDDELERTLVLFSTLQGLLQLQKQARFSKALLDLGPLVTHAVRALLIGWGAKAKTVDAALAALPGGA